jgi:hypothetical protein
MDVPNRLPNYSEVEMSKGAGQLPTNHPPAGSAVIPVNMTPDLANAILDYMFSIRSTNRAATIRYLMWRGLDAEAKPKRTVRVRR